MMRTARVLMVMVALAAVIGWSSAATATSFDVTVNVGFESATGTCQVVSGGTLHTDCLGSAGTGGFTGTSTRLNWDNSTTNTVDSYLSIGALPFNPATNFPNNSPANVGAIPIGSATTTITDNNAILYTAEIRHTNNAIPQEDSFLATVTLDTELIIKSGATTLFDLPFNPLVTFLETPNVAPCNLTSNTLGSTCDDQFTFDENLGQFDIPFSFGGQDFVLHIQGLVNFDLTAACEAGQGTELNCLTAENQVNNRFVVISIENVTTPQVPAPAGLLLLGVGLVGMVIRKRLAA